MSWRGLWYAVGATMLTWLTLSAHAGTFKDPLDTPAEMSALTPSSRLSAVTRAGERLVAVGRMGHIMVSEDAGKTWKQVPVPVRSDLVAVRFVTPDNGWAVGFDGVVLHSTDGGRNWVKQLDGVQAAKLMQAYYEKRAAAGDPDPDKMRAEAKRYIDQGADKPFFDVLFLNENEGFIVGAFNLSFHTKDGGKTWEPLVDRTENPNGMHLYALAAVGGEVYLAGEQGLLRRWNRDRERFEVLDQPYKGSFFGVLAKDTTLITFGMRGNAFRSTDSGKTWNKLETGTVGGLNAGMILPDGRIVFATASGELIVSADGGNTFARKQADKPMSYYGMALAGSDSMALVGASGVRMESIK